MKYYIFRHAQTYFSKHDRNYGDQNETAEILPEAIPITEKLAEYLNSKDVDKYFTSPFKRALQTAEIIEKVTGKKFTVDPRIGEENITYGKEKFEDLILRLNDLLVDFKNKNLKSIAICSHGWPIAALVALITKGKVERKDLDNYPTPGVLLEIDGKNMKEINFN